MARWRSVARRKRYGSRAFSRERVDLTKFAKIGFLGAVGLVVVFFVAVFVFSFSLPSPEKIARRDGFSTKILDRKGEVLYDIFTDQRRTPLAVDAVPEKLKQATVAIEDKNFYKHQGFDPFGMVRGFSRLITRGRAQGGSTLTQQLVKNVLLSPERSVFRKIKEFILAVQVERTYTKDE